MNEDGWRVRGISRDPTSEKAQTWAEKGIEIVKADLDDVESLERAFKGSNAIFIVTDYVANARKSSGNAASRSIANDLGKTIEAYAGDLEEAQAINAAKAASHPEVLATLERYVFSTLPAVTEISGGKYAHAHEFDSKANAEKYIRQNLPLLAQRLSTVTMGNYLENWPYITALAPQKEEDGSYSFLWLDCPGEHIEHPELWAARDAGAFVKALVLDHPAGTDVLAATAIIGSKDYAAMWSKVMGFPAVSKVVSEPEYAALVPEEIRIEFIELIKFVTEYGVGPHIKTAAELGIQVTPLEDFIKDQRWQL